MKRKRIIWFGAHSSPAAAQLEELDRLWPGCEVVIVKDRWSCVDDVIDRYHELKGDEMVAVLPLSMVRSLCKRGYTVLWSDMEREHEDNDIVDKHKGRMNRYKFYGFRRLVKVKMVFTRITPGSSASLNDPAEVE